MFEHDYKNYPELTNAQIDEFGFTSPHKQITEDFNATVTQVHDGDTITLKVDWRDFEFKLRFLNIDAPELNAGGEVAGDWLRSQILNATVEVKINPKNRVDKYGRLLGSVIYNGMDMGEVEMNLGLSQAYGQKLEGEVPPQNKFFNQKQWFG